MDFPLFGLSPRLSGCGMGGGLCDIVLTFRMAADPPFFAALTTHAFLLPPSIVIKSTVQQIMMVICTDVAI